MSYVDNNKEDEFEEVYVVTYKELIFIAIVFSVILIVLYPKDLIKQEIRSENSNYDLSMLYLKDLIEHSPNDESLKLILAEQSLRSGKKEQSLELLNKLIFSKNIKRRNKALLLSYELRKSRYFDIETEFKQEKERKILKELFKQIYSKKLYDEKDLDKWYNEAVFNQHYEAMYYFVKKKLQKEPTNVKLLDMAYFLATKFKDKKNAAKYIELLVKYDTKNQDKWATAYFYYLVNAKQYKKAQKIVEKFSNLSKDWTLRLADFYTMRKLYKKSSKIYLQLFNEAKKYDEKKKYFFKALGALQAGGYLKKSANLAHKYEDYYIKDVEVRKFLLKLYLQTDSLDYAVGLSKKILKSMFK